MKNQLSIRLNAETGNKVTPFKRNPEKGYIILEERTEDYSMGWFNEEVRSCVVKGNLTLLDKIVSKPLYGRIVIREYLESEILDSDSENSIIPSEIKRYLENDKNYQSSIKRTAKDGIELTLNGDLIFRFSTYDPTGLVEDRFIDHDNDDEVAAWRSNK